MPSSETRAARSVLVLQAVVEMVVGVGARRVRLLVQLFCAAGERGELDYNYKVARLTQQGTSVAI
jgi:hypothetical protein